MKEPKVTTLDDLLSALHLAASAGRDVDPFRVMKELSGLAGAPLAQLLDRTLTAEGQSSDPAEIPVRIGKPIGRDEVSQRHEAMLEGASLIRRVFSSWPTLGPRELLSFRAELDLLRTLGDDRLVDTVDCGLGHDGVFIFERAPTGPTLREALAKLEDEAVSKPADRLELVKAVAETARLIDRAHEIGLVHARLGAQDIVLGSEGPELRGLGLATLEGDANWPTSLERLAYRAPETLVRQPLRVDRRADVWSLGAILHRIVTGAPPIAAHSEAELRRESARFVPRAARSAAQGMPPGLDAVIASALAPERSRRYGRAAAFAADIERAIEGLPPLARRPGLGDRFLRWMRREPGIAAGGFVLFALLGTAGVVTGWFVGVGDRDAAVEPLEARISRETAIRAAEERAGRELDKDRSLAAALDEIGALVDVLRCGRFGPIDHDRLLDLYLRAYRKRGIELEHRLDSDASADILAGAHARSASDARRLMSGLYGISNLLGTMAADSSSEVDQERSDLHETIERNVTIMVERCEKDRSFRHLWRVARHGDQGAVDRFDAFLDPGHWRRQSPDYLIFLAAQLARSPERAEASFQLVEEAVGHHADSRALQVLSAGLILRRALARTPVDATALRGALLHLEIAVALQPRSAPVRLLLGLAQAQDADYRAALLNVDEATRIESESALIWLMRARFFEQSPMTDRAREAAERALELDPGLDQARELLLALDEAR